MHLKDIIQRAKKNGNIPAPVGRYTLRASIDDVPSHRLTNTIAAFRSEMEDILSRPLEIAGGGVGCLYVHIDVGSLSQGEIDELSKFVSRPENQRYFRDRYQINSLILAKP